MIRKKIALKLKWTWRDLMKSTVHFNSLKGEVRVLCFHGICRDDQPYINGRFLKESRFVSLMEQLKAKCNFLTYDQFSRGVIADDRLNILVTFDDAYLNNQTILLPHLETLKIPILLFATNNQEGFWMDLLDIIMNDSTLVEKLEKKLPLYAGKQNSELKSLLISKGKDEQMKFRDLCKEVIGDEVLDQMGVFWQLMNTEQIQTFFKSNLITLGNHSVSHLSFIGLSDEQIKSEIQDCSSYLKGISEDTISSFAYPFGHYSERTTQLISTLTIAHQFIADGSNNAPAGTVDRLVINPFISERNQLFAIRDGKY